MILESKYANYTLPKQNSSAWIINNLEKYKNDIAFIDASTNEKITFKSVKEEVFAYQKVLHDAGLKPGCIVGVMLPFHWKSCSLIIAISSCEAISAFCHIGEKPEAINKRLIETKVDFFIGYNEEFLKSIKKCNTQIQYLILFSKIHQQMKNFQIDSHYQESVTVNEDISSYDKTMFIFNSTGTTGKPKGIIRTQKAVMSVILSNASCYGAKQGDVVIISIPQIHSGSVTSFLLNLILGITQIIIPEPTYEIIKCQIDLHNVTLLLTTFVSLYTEVIEKLGNKTSLKIVMFGGTPFPAHLYEQLEANTGAAAHVIYGATEVGTATFRISTYPSNSVGKLLPKQTLKIEDINASCKILGPNEPGELCIKGPSTSPGYINRTDMIANNLGWYHTGDYGYYDKEGNIYILDRIRDVIKGRGGVSVFPSEIEAMLLKHHYIHDAAVISVPHPKFIETAKAYVVRMNDSLSETDVMDYVKEEMAAHKQLHGGVEFIDEIPRVGIGKISKRVLKQMHEKQCSNLTNN